MTQTQHFQKSLLGGFGLSTERDYFIENMSMLVSSGMTILDAIDSVAGDFKLKRMKGIVANIRLEVESGSSLWKALKVVGIFSNNTISLVRLGEESGRLAENLRIVSLQEQKDRVFRSRIRSAMMYPVFVLALSVVIGIGIAWFILPKLATVFSQMHIKLPLITKLLIGAGKFIGEYGYFVLPLVLLSFGLMIAAIFYIPKTRALFQSTLLYVPGIRKLMIETELSRFGYLFGTLLDAGLAVPQALVSLSDAAYVPPYKRFYAYLAKSIEDGNSFQQSFAAYKGLSHIVPNPIQHLIVSAEKSGRLSSVLISISKDFEDRSEVTTKNLSIILEPVLLVIVWLAVVSVALAVILPIYSLVGGFHG